MHYQQAGQGRDLVMIHGLFANLAFWYLTVLPELMRQFRVTVYDLRGHGMSDMPRNGYTSRDMASDLNALLTHLNVDKCHLVGHSYGGAVAMHYALMHPQRVRSLTLADARIPGLQPEFLPHGARRWRFRRMRLRRAGFDVPDDLPRVAYSYLEELVRLRKRNEGKPVGILGAASLFDSWKKDSQRARKWKELVRATSAAKDFSEASGLTSDNIRQITHPSLIIYGEHSDCKDTLRGLEKYLPNYIKTIVPDAGHFHPVLKPQVFVQNLVRFTANAERRRT